MTDAKFAKLVKLRDSGESLADRGPDIRGRRVIDKHGRSIGKIDALLVDEKDKKIRFLEVESGGILGLGEAKSFIPVDAITEVTDDDVHIDQDAGNVAGAPVYDPALIDHAKFFEDTYGYYGMMPFWAGNYAYPTYPGRDPLDRN